MGAFSMTVPNLLLVKILASLRSPNPVSETIFSTITEEYVSLIGGSKGSSSAREPLAWRLVMAPLEVSLMVLQFP